MKTWKTNLMNKLLLIGCLLVVSTLSLYSQEVLKIGTAVEIALENNYDIRLSKNELAIAKENKTYGNAGILPSATANLTQNNSTQNSTQVQNTGVERSLDNARNNSLNYGVSLGWTIFDGMGMFARYDKLEELEQQGHLQVKRQVLTTVGDVITLYYTIVEQNNLLAALDSSIQISKERLRTAENRFSIGKAAKLEVLNVQVNLNEDISMRLRQEETVKNLKTNLNSILVRDLDTEFGVDSKVNIDETLVFSELYEKANKFNPDLQLILINRKLAELDLKVTKASRYPTVRLNSGYNFSTSESSLGFVASSSARGLNYGVTASMNLFDGFNQRKKEKIAQLDIDNASIMVEQQQHFVRTNLKTAFQTYLTNLELLKLEETNEGIARQNLEITLAKFNIGSISAIEFRDAQENFIDAISRYNAAQLQAKLSEVQLKELIGEIDF